MKYLKIEYLKKITYFAQKEPIGFNTAFATGRKSPKQNRNWLKQGINSCWLICAW